MEIGKPEWQYQIREADRLKSTPQMRELLDDLEAKFFDDGVGEDVAGDAFDLGGGYFAGEAVEGQYEEFSLADVFDFGVAEPSEGTVDGLSLGIEDGGFGHDPDVGFHDVASREGEPLCQY